MPESTLTLQSLPSYWREALELMIQRGCFVSVLCSLILFIYFFWSIQLFVVSAVCFFCSTETEIADEEEEAAEEGKYKLKAIDVPCI